MEVYKLYSKNIIIEGKSLSFSLTKFGYKLLLFLLL